MRPNASSAPAKPKDSALGQTVRLALAVVLVSAGGVHAQTTIQDIIDAILAGTTPAEADINRDGRVDALDVACFVSECPPVGAPIATFSGTSVTTDEGEGLLLVSVMFTGPIDCVLNYTVDGTATPGSDYEPLSGTIAVNGASVNIPITLIDDGTMSEEIEIIALALETGLCYELGPFSQQTILITDNDARWYGTLMNAETHIGFILEVTRTHTSDSATLVGDGNCTLPAGGWAASTFTFTGDSFVATIDPVPVASTANDFAVGLIRTFSFTASDGQSNQLVEDDLVRGVFSETIAPVDSANAHLMTSLSGAFTLASELLC